jgi:hypothetical protein
MPVIQALRRLRQICKSKASLGYIGDPVSKTKTNNKDDSKCCKEKGQNAESENNGRISAVVGLSAGYTLLGRHSSHGQALLFLR